MSLMDKIRELRGRVEIDEDYAELFNSERGRRVLFHLMKVTGITNPSFTTDPSALLLERGQQRLAYAILQRAVGSEDAAAKFILQSLEQNTQDKQNDSIQRSAL